MDIQKTASELRTEGQRLMAQGKKLIEAAEVLDGGESRLFIGVSNPLARAIGAEPIAHGARIGTRLEQVLELLTANGPMAGGAILKETKMPRGTLYNIFRDKGKFEQTEQGLWKIKEAK
jgi:hypothetical protein